MHSNYPARPNAMVRLMVRVLPAFRHLYGWTMIASVEGQAPLLSLPSRMVIRRWRARSVGGGCWRPGQPVRSLTSLVRRS